MLAPAMKGHWLRGQYDELRADPIALFTRAVKEHGDFVRLRFFHLPLLVVNDPEAVRCVLETREASYPRQANSSKVMREFVGDGILTANGEHWAMQRRAIEPYVQKRQISEAYGVMREEIWAAFERWRENGVVTLDIARATKVIGFRVMVRLLFGYQATWREAEEFTDSATFGQEDVMDRLVSIVPPPLSLPLQRNERLKSAMSFGHSLCERMIREGAAGASGKYLEAILEASSRPSVSADGKPDLHWARQMMMTILIVGSENPSNTVAWALALLARHPAVLRQVLEEVERTGERETPPGPSDLPVITRVLHETLRLYPGGWALDRMAAADDKLGPYDVEKGTAVLVSPYLLHRNERYWPDAEKFDPDRFLPGRREQLHKFAYFPFGGGSHRCVGPGYAYQFIPLFLCELLKAFEYRSLATDLPKPQALFTLRPKGGVPIQILPLPRGGEGRGEGRSRSSHTGDRRLDAAPH